MSASASNSAAKDPLTNATNRAIWLHESHTDCTVRESQVQLLPRQASGLARSTEGKDTADCSVEHDCTLPYLSAWFGNCWMYFSAAVWLAFSLQMAENCCHFNCRW